MRIFDQTDPMTLERRDAQLWVLAITMILILGAGTAILMYPMVFTGPAIFAGGIPRNAFFGFCVLCVLLAGYLIDRQLMIRQLRRRLAEEEKQNIRLHHQASTDLLECLPGYCHFQDRLAMEFRRAVTTQQPLSLVVVSLKSAGELSDPHEINTSFGDAAKVLIRRLRRQDSIYLFESGVFGIVLPGATGTEASGIAARLADGLRDASGASDRFLFDLGVVNYPEHVATARQMEQQVAQRCPTGRQPEPRVA